MNFNIKDIFSFKRVIEDIVDARLKNKGITSFVSAIVTGINDDNTVNVKIPPDNNRFVNNVLNKSNETLNVGDSVELCTKNGKLSNCWVAVKHGNSSINIRNPYPIGSIYISVVNTNPSTWFGGEWVSFGTGQCLVGVDTTQAEFNTVMKTGGEKTHKLTVDEMPSHTHDLNNGYIHYQFGDEFCHRDGTGSWTFGSGIYSIANTGGDKPHNNMQPYKVVAYWKRVA